MDLKRLRYFLVVAEELSFTRAAARLRISQPPLSQMIARMEEELGFKLFVRTKRKVALTEGGRALMNDSRIALGYAEDAVIRARRAANGEVGHLRVAFVPWADMTQVFFETFRQLGDEAPDVAVDFHSMPSTAATRALIEGRIDVAFINQPAHPVRGMDHELAVADEMVAALPANHPLANEEVIPLARLVDEPHIVVAPDRVVPRHSPVRTLYAQNGYDLKARHMIDHPQTTLTLVASGIGISVVPSSYRNVQRPGVVFRRIAPTSVIPLIAVWKAENITPVTEKFIQILRRVRSAAPSDGDTATITRPDASSPLHIASI